MSSPTPRQKLLLWGTSSDFSISPNVDRHCAIGVLLPPFEYARKEGNFENSYHEGPKLPGRKSTVSSVDLLGLSLWSIKSSSRQYSLCTIFEMAPTSINVLFDYSLKMLYKGSKEKIHAALKAEWPSVEKMNESVDNPYYNCPNENIQRGISEVVDGRRLPCATYKNLDMKNEYYKWYTGNVKETNLFVFNFFGVIIHAAINFSGSLHDSNLATMSRLLDPKLGNEMTPLGFVISGDSAFSTNGTVSLVKNSASSKNKRVLKCLRERSTCNYRLAITTLASQWKTICRIWGIEAVKAPFGCLQNPLSAGSS